jgi:hypothetical protein
LCVLHKYRTVICNSCNTFKPLPPIVLLCTHVTACVSVCVCVCKRVRVEA